MTNPDAARSFLCSEVETLEAFDFVVASPAGHPLNVLEVTRRGDGPFEVRAPGRPRIFPELPASVRNALQERGFASEKPTDSTKPWVKAVGDAASAVALVQQVLVEVFDEKPDVALDIGHGSHKAEHEARQRLAAVRRRIETVLGEMAGRRPQQDADDDYIVPIGDVHVVVAPRVSPGGPVIVRVFAVTNVGVPVAPELGLFLARLNFGLMFGRFVLDADHRSIWFDETLLGDQFRDQDFRFAVQVVASAADQWDDRLKQMFGGATYQEFLRGGTRHEPPPTKPGEGGYV